MLPQQKTERVQLNDALSELKAMGEWSFANRVRGRSEAIRGLIELGLGHVPGEAASRLPSGARPEATTRKIAERRAAAAQGRKSADRALKRARVMKSPA